MKSRIACAAVLLVGVHLESVALAQPALSAPPPPPPPASAAPAAPAAPAARPLAEVLTGRAKDDYIEGHKIFADGDFATALLKFESVYASSKDPRLFWNFGACHKGLRRYAEAIRDLERYKAEAASLLTDKDRTDADALITALRPYVAQVTIRANEEGASVAIDDVAVGTTPIDKRLVDIGQHRLALKKSGFRDYSDTLDIAGPADLVRDVTLSTAAHEGRIAVYAGSGDTIAIDGKNMAMAQYEGAIPSGRHAVHVTAPGKRPYDGNVVIEDGQLRTMDVNLEADRPIVPTWVWIGAGAVAAVGLTIGAILVFRGDSTPGQTSPVLGSMPPQLVQLPSWRL